MLVPRLFIFCFELKYFQLLLWEYLVSLVCPVLLFGTNIFFTSIRWSMLDLKETCWLKLVATAL
jgi:hypothetical protein